MTGAVVTRRFKMGFSADMYRPGSVERFRARKFFVERTYEYQQMYKRAVNALNSFMQTRPLIQAAVNELTWLSIMTGTLEQFVTRVNDLANEEEKERQKFIENRKNQNLPPAEYMGTEQDYLLENKVKLARESLLAVSRLEDQSKVRRPFQRDAISAYESPQIVDTTPSYNNKDNKTIQGVDKVKVKKPPVKKPIPKLRGRRG